MGKSFEMLPPIVGKEDVVFQDEGVVKAEVPDVSPKRHVASRAGPLPWIQPLLEGAMELVVQLVWRDGGPSSAWDAQPFQSSTHR